MNNVHPEPPENGNRATPAWVGFVVFGVLVAIMVGFFSLVIMHVGQSCHLVGFNTSNTHSPLSRQTIIRRRVAADRIHFDPESHRQGIRENIIQLAAYPPPGYSAEARQTYKDLRADFDKARVRPNPCSQSAECVICLERFEDKSLVLALPCHHLFHPGCITSWLLDHNTCPICKAHYVPHSVLPSMPLAAFRRWDWRY
ncbi:uncharacterized protein B0H64DRAFT_406067 [Chaetomium fimeti]|uniref:RING-type domain-containing protein n=1 Tax=Chaetomium fimeti TaxID=1854472 RepID=A0AAE0H9D0_9PEZI|nr:hypothetical protein B0H64DRAFT_406067 [Chaetomium fimeti]